LGGAQEGRYSGIDILIFYHIWPFEDESKVTLGSSSVAKKTLLVAGLAFFATFLESTLEMK
jgi:hypothetical protein